MNTPDNIVSLGEHQIFVFGSNAEGHHAGGAAKVAVERFGAVWGRGEGLQGDSYAIPTMEGIESLKLAVARFLYFAASNPGLEFLVTKIGTGIAGYSVEDIAPLFVDAAPNVILPAEFEAVFA
ncbi:hypothetical protein BH09ACT9_BH09ACT9_00150 [soil metagenome]